ncbi:MAG: hypothetical protein AAF513_06605 [Pseudomonadota bacterium]
MQCKTISVLIASVLSLSCASQPAPTSQSEGPQMMTKLRVERVGDGPLIHPGLDLSIGNNIQGPSLIAVPDWVENRLGNYYLYFADHKGAYIRLAYADALTGPWRIHVPGALQLPDSHFLTAPPPVSKAQAEQIRAAFVARGMKISHDPVAEVTAPHIASPDVHVDEARRRIVMYFHGLEDVGYQVTRVATSRDGIAFSAHPEVLGRTYFRAFDWQGTRYGMAMPGQFYRLADDMGPFEEGPLLFNQDMRHAALLVRDDELLVFWTQVGEVPEHIKVSSIDLTEDWRTWKASAGVEVLRPERVWEGARAPLTPSVRSTAYGLVNQLRDPAIFVQGEDVYLLYAYGGESGIGLARVIFDQVAAGEPGG